METEAWDTDWTVTIPYGQSGNYDKLNTLAKRTRATTTTTTTTTRSNQSQMQH